MAAPISQSGFLSPARGAGPGMAGFLAAFAMVGAAMALHPGFSLWDNSLSDLGVSDQAWLFNGGVIVGGGLGLWFCLFLAARFTRGMPLRIAGVALLGLSFASLTALGIVTESWGRLHFWVSVAFFLPMLLASLLLGLSMVRVPALRMTGLAAVAAALMGGQSWLLPRGKGQAIPELVSAAVCLAWLLLLGIKIYQGRTGE